MDEHQAHEAVRRLLADARHDEPLPPAVAERLDSVLAGLVRERTEAPSGEVVDLSARRRHRFGAFVAAAAAVVVAGVGVGQVMTQTPPRPTSEAASAEPAPSAEAEAGADASGPEFEDLQSAKSAPPRQHTTSQRRSTYNEFDMEASGGAQLDSGPPRFTAKATDARIRTELDATPPVDEMQALNDSLANGRSPMAATAACLGASRRAVQVIWEGERAYALWLPVDDPVRIEISTCAGELVRTVPLR